MKQTSSENFDQKAFELLCTSLGFVKSQEHLKVKEKVILQKSQNQDFMPLSLIEQELLKNQAID